MKSFMKKSLAVLLTLAVLSGSFMCLAAVELNETAVSEHYGQFKNYLLLGDSAASGYRDEITENDELFNEAYNETTYWRVPGSYADIIANAIIEDKSMTAFAGPGFRTIEIRYMLEDDYAAECDDEYLFHPSQLYVYEDYGYLPGDERIRQAYKKAVAEADLITLGVGGNDWGAYLGWVVTDIFEEENVADKYVKMVQDIMDEGTMDMSTIEKLVEIAHIAGALPALATKLPEALSYGLGTFYKNWDIMIQDIYNYNPDVTLMVVGMSDNSIKGKYYDYNGVEGEVIETQQNAATAGIMKTIVDFIMSVGNGPMIEGAETFGYTYVDIDGATYVDSHPDAGGHIFIANKIIEALPDPDISKRYEDVKPGHKYYNDIEYVVSKGIMSATGETTFSPDDALTDGQLAEAMNAISGTEKSTDGEKEVTVLEFATGFFGAAGNKGITGFFKSIGFSFRVLFAYKLNVGGKITRAEAAKYLREFAEL